MLTAEHMEAMSSSDFTKSAVLHAAGSGSIFPLIFDDLEKKRITEWGKWGKMYWDSAYRDGRAFPQLIVTANDRIDSGGPLGRRVREIPMHAAYSNNQKNSNALKRFSKMLHKSSLTSLASCLTTSIFWRTL